MKSRVLIISAALVSVSFAATPAVAKKQPQIAGLQLQQLQSHDFEAGKNTVFSAVMTVLQDAGYRIQAGDRDTGLITGIGSSNSHMTFVPFVGIGKTKLTPAVSAYIEEMGPALTRVRLNFVMSKNKANRFGADLGDEKPVEDAGVYQDAFEKIGQGVFLRQSMAPKSQPVASTQVQPAVAQGG